MTHPCGTLGYAYEYKSGYKTRELQCHLLMYIIEEEAGWEGQGIQMVYIIYTS